MKPNVDGIAELKKKKKKIRAELKITRNSTIKKSPQIWSRFSIFRLCLAATQWRARDDNRS